MVTKRKAADAAPEKKLRYEPWRFETVMRERAELLAADVHAAVDEMLDPNATISFDELDQLESALGRLKRAPRPAPDLEAVRALSIALDALRAKEARADVAARCLAALKQADSRFGKVNAQQFFAALAKFAPFAPLASKKGKRTLVGVLAELAAICGALDVVGSYTHEEATDLLAKRVRRAKARSVR